MLFYSRIFLKSSGISLISVGIPTLWWIKPIDLRNTSLVQAKSSQNSRYSHFAEKINLIGEKEASEEKIIALLKKDMETNEYCPREDGERRDPIHCKNLKDVMESFDAIKPNFSRRIYLHHPTKEEKVLLAEFLKTKDPEYFNFYFRNTNHMKKLLHHITPHERIPEGSIDGYSRSKISEIRGLFGEGFDVETSFHNWRYRGIFKRLAENNTPVILKSKKIKEYYRFFGSPTREILMPEEATYFYSSGGSKWSGWKDGKYILNFKEALDTYIPKN